MNPKSLQASAANGTSQHFQLHGTCPDTHARWGRLRLHRGEVLTPTFMPVGTQASVKALDNRELSEMGSQIILGNTYHLFIRPGLEIIEAAGGLHGFMNWKRPILTDSGGFQVFSLAKIRKIEAHGVSFRSHVDGSPLFIGPVESMAIQRTLGSDVAMLFDECPPHTASEKETLSAVQKTLEWARICAEQPRAEGQLYFGIVQGAGFPDLRRQCAEELTAMEFDGYAIGGVSVGEPEPDMFRAVEYTTPYLPRQKPRYAMGLGTPAQLVELVARGVDMFDCVLPTRVARNGTAFTYAGAINLRASIYKSDFQPIERDCDCFACARYTRAYLRHLLKSEEILGLRMVSVHNSHLYLRLMREIRANLIAGSFAEFRERFVANYTPTSRVRAAREADAR